MKRVSASVSIPTRAPGKVDRRFIIGVVLVIASVIAFSVLSGLLRGGTRVYTVTTTIAPGDAITADNVRETVLRVDASVYAPTSEAPMGSVATRQLAPGQILMRSDIAQETAESAGDTVRLAVTVTTGLPDEVADGTKIRLWTVPTRTQAQGAPAREIEGTFTFVRTIEATSSSQTRRGQRIEILADAQSLPVLLAAQSSTDGLAAVPVGAP